MKKLVICGAGGMGGEILSLVRVVNEKEQRWDILGFTDVALRCGAMAHGLPVLGDDTFLKEMREPCDVVLAVGDPQLRSRIIASLEENQHLSYPTLVHPLAYVAKEATLGRGVIVSPFSVVLANATLGDFVFVNYLSSVAHDTTVGKFTMVMPKVGISGFTNIGECVLVGTGSLLLQGLSIGNHAVVGIGSVVTVDVPPNVTILGNPPRIIAKNKTD